MASSASKTTRDCACAVATESSSSSPARRVPSRLTRKQFSEPIVISSAATCTCATLLAEFANAVCSCFVSSFFTAALSWLHACPTTHLVSSHPLSAAHASATPHPNALNATAWS